MSANTPPTGRSRTFEEVYAKLWAKGHKLATVHQVHWTLQTALNEAFCRGRLASDLQDFIAQSAFAAPIP